LYVEITMLARIDFNSPCPRGPWACDSIGVKRPSAQKLVQKLSLAYFAAARPRISGHDGGTGSTLGPRTEPSSESGRLSSGSSLRCLDFRSLQRFIVHQHAGFICPSLRSSSLLGPPHPNKKYDALYDALDRPQDIGIGRNPGFIRSLSLLRAIPVVLRDRRPLGRT